MRDDLRIPDLTFPDVEFGPNETPWNLDVLLFKGGPLLGLSAARAAISSGALGDPQWERVPLVVKIHEIICGWIAEGGSRDYAGRGIELARTFFAFCERNARECTADRAIENYCAWSVTLHHRTKIPKGAKGPNGLGRLGEVTAYQYAAAVGTILDRALERVTRSIELTPLKPPTSRKSPIGVEAEKQNLGDTFALGRFLQDLCDGIELAKIKSEEDNILIPLRGRHPLQWTSHAPVTQFTCPEASLPSERYALANLRIEAELLMFIAQTGINVAQAVNAQFRHFFYISYLDGYQVKDYKHRRGGGVLFEIFKEYKQHFERYLRWRNELFPNSQYLFPLIGEPGVRRAKLFSNRRVRAVCSQEGIPYVTPRQLRNTRVNWLLRRSSDVDQTAELAQHTKETLIRVYHRPSFQRAMAESTRFWSKFDPNQNKTLSLSPGMCTGRPKAASDLPPAAPAPDCEKTSGCLWCESHRDVDSFDYVWALSSFMHLKGVELTKSGPPRPEIAILPPAKLAVDRILEKLKWFEESNELRRSWVEEAQARIAEESFHGDFAAAILDLGAVHG